MSRDRLATVAKTVSGRPAKTPLGEIVQRNLLLHLPLGLDSHLHRKPSASIPWAITQISSGMLCGYFHDQDSAEFFAERAIIASPALAAGSEVPAGDWAVLGKLRKTCGGWAPTLTSGRTS